MLGAKLIKRRIPKLMRTNQKRKMPKKVKVMMPTMFLKSQLALLTKTKSISSL